MNQSAPALRLTNLAADRPRGDSAAAGIVVVDSYPATRFGIRCAVEAEQEMTFLGEADDPHGALSMAESLKPGVVITDLVFPHGTGLDLIKDLQIRCPDCRIVVYSGMEGWDYPEKCLRLGANAYVSKTEPLANLIQAIRISRKGRIYVSEDRANTILSRLSSKKLDVNPIDKLSDGEFAVFHLIGQGLSNQNIAMNLNRSIKTIETYRSRIKRKLGISNATQLAQFASERIRNTSGSLIRTKEVCATPSPVAPVSNDGATLLVVDDHAITRDPLIRLMRYHGYTVLSARDGCEALEILGNNEVDLMVLDLMMPRMTGVTLLETVRADPRWKNLPVVVLTGMVDCQALQRVRAFTDDVMIKAAFDIDALFNRVSSLLSEIVECSLPDQD